MAKDKDKDKDKNPKKGSKKKYAIPALVTYGLLNRVHVFATSQGTTS